MILAPIVLFVYNRPLHAKQVLQALEANDLAAQSELFVYSDGPKPDASPEDIIQINHVRSIIRNRKWCRKTEIIESKINRGLGNSISHGVSEIIEKYGQIIVLEDDLVTSKGFLVFMNEALNIYRNDNRVMQVSGTNYYSKFQKRLPITFFSRYVETCGWGTWKRAWDYYINDPLFLYNDLEKKNQFYQFTCDGTTDFKIQLEQNINGKLNTWGVKWAASVFLKEGLVLQPGKSLIQNIGFDGSGDNCGVADDQQLFWKNKTDYVKVERIKINESKIGKRHLKEFYKDYCHTRKSRMKDTLFFLVKFFHLGPIKRGILDLIETPLKH